jgi:hypothetical protein
MEDMMQYLLSVVARKLTDLALECVKWTLVGVVCLVVMWFLTVGLPTLVAIINGQPPAPIIHSATVPSIPSVAGLMNPGGTP